MAAVSLTDAYIRGLPPPSSGRLEVTDLRCPGLTLRVTSSGAKSFAFRYRDKTTGKLERLTLGRYPDMPLADARREVGSQRAQIAKGANPRKEVRKARTRERTAVSISQLIDLYLAGYVARETPKSLGTVRGYLSAVRTAWASRKATDIGRAEVIDFLRKRALAAPVAANRTRTILGFGLIASS